MRFGSRVGNNSKKKMHGALHQTGGLALAEIGLWLTPLHQSRAKTAEGGNLQAGAKTGEKYTRSPSFAGAASRKKSFCLIAPQTGQWLLCGARPRTFHNSKLPFKEVR